MDVVPGRTTMTWFEATREGSYDLECTVICGVSHSLMLAKVVVVPEDEFKVWYFGGPDAPEPGEATAPPKDPAIPEGLALMTAKGCLNCHSVDGSTVLGPTLKGVYGKQEDVLVADVPRTVTVDEAYLRGAIETPLKEIVKDYPPFMTETPLEPGELDTIVAYIKTLK